MFKDFSQELDLLRSYLHVPKMLVFTMCFCIMLSLYEVTISQLFPVIVYYETFILFWIFRKV